MSSFRRAFVTIFLVVGALVEVPICNVAGAEGDPQL